MTEKAKLDLQAWVYILLFAAVLSFGVLYILKHGDNLILKYQTQELKAEADSAKAKFFRQKAKDSTTIQKLQERLKNAESAASSFQEVLKEIKDRLEKIEANTRKLRWHYPHAGIEPHPQSSPSQTQPLLDNWEITQTNYVPIYHDTIYLKPPVYYYFKTEYGEWPMHNVRKPGGLGIGPSIGTGITNNGQIVTYLGVGINYNIIRFR